MVAHRSTPLVFVTRVTVRAQEVVTAGGRPSLVVFYAGHAGVDGLHLTGEVGGQPYDALLAPTVLYSPVTEALWKAGVRVHYAANITGQSLGIDRGEMPW